jgi:lycopene beta-cyclase
VQTLPASCCDREEVDVAVVGAGGAGLSVLIHLAAALDRDDVPGVAPSVVLIDPQHRRGSDRTWCWWDPPLGSGGSVVASAGPELAGVVHRSWDRLVITDRRRRSHLLDLGPLRYHLVRSSDFYALAERAIARVGARRVLAGVDEVRDGPGGVVVRAAGREIRARWVLDSRPGPPFRPARTSWLQHFRGWVVRFPAGSPGAPSPLDPRIPVLMDFSAPQPAEGTGFGYVLPLDERRALVEYTVFSRHRLPGPDYDRMLRGYLEHRWGPRGAAVTVESVEDGAIPMTDAVHRRRVGARVFRIGTAGGATRASTGYTFAAIQRQARAVVGALLAGERPEPPPAYPARHRWLDSVFLRAMDRGHLDGADYLCDLFTGNPPGRVLGFLDGTSTVGDDVRLALGSPRGPMLRATAEDLLARVGQPFTRSPGRLPGGDRGALVRSYSVTHSR